MHPLHNLFPYLEKSAKHCILTSHLDQKDSSMLYDQYTKWDGVT